MELLCSTQGTKILEGLLKEHLLAEFLEGHISTIMEEINIHVSHKRKSIVEPPTQRQATLDGDILAKFERMESSRQSTRSGFTLEFHPSDERVFKDKLLQTKRARRTWYYTDGREETDIWDASNLTITSNLNGNIYSNNKVRQRDKIGLVRLKFEIIELKR